MSKFQELYEQFVPMSKRQIHDEIVGCQQLVEILENIGQTYKIQTSKVFMF